MTSGLPRWSMITRTSGCRSNHPPQRRGVLGHMCTCRIAPVARRRVPQRVIPQGVQPARERPDSTADEGGSPTAPVPSTVLDRGRCPALTDRPSRWPGRDKDSAPGTPPYEKRSAEGAALHQDGVSDVPPPCPGGATPPGGHAAGRTLASGAGRWPGASSAPRRGRGCRSYQWAVCTMQYLQICIPVCIPVGVHRRRPAGGGAAGGRRHRCGYHPPQPGGGQGREWRPRAGVAGPGRPAGAERERSDGHWHGAVRRAAWSRRGQGAGDTRQPGRGAERCL